MGHPRTAQRVRMYVTKVTQLGDDMNERLEFYYDYLQDEDSMLDRDTYDEFASAPYDAIKQLRPKMDHDQLVAWITDPEMSAQRKRLFLTMLGVCGDEKDLPTLEKMLRSTQKSSRGGLDALIACYLTLAGEKGLPLIDDLFLANKKRRTPTPTRRSWPSVSRAPKETRFHAVRWSNRCITSWTAPTSPIW